MYQIWLFQIRPEQDLAGFQNSNLSHIQLRIWSDLGENLFSHHRTVCLIKLMASTMLPAATEAVQFGVSLVPSLFASFWQNLWHGNEFCVFFVQVTLINIAYSPLDRSAAIVLSIVNWSCYSCTGICQIQQICQKIWPEQDFARFLKNGRIPDLLELKSGTTLKRPLQLRFGFDSTTTIAIKITIRLRFDLGIIIVC